MQVSTPFGWIMGVAMTEAEKKMCFCVDVESLRGQEQNTWEKTRCRWGASYVIP